MKIKEIEFDYDKEADVLYMSLGKPKEAVVEEVGNIGIRVDEKTKEVVGLTIIEFMKSFGKAHKPVRISIKHLLKSAKTV